LALSSCARNGYNNLTLSCYKLPSPFPDAQMPSIHKIFIMRLSPLLLALLFGHIPTLAQEPAITCIDSRIPLREISDCTNLFPLISVGPRDENLALKYNIIYSFPAAFRHLSCVVTIIPIVNRRHPPEEFPKSFLPAYGAIFSLARQKAYQIINRCAMTTNRRNHGSSTIEVSYRQAPSSRLKHFTYEINVFGSPPNIWFPGRVVRIGHELYHDYNTGFLNYSMASGP
jgi:hypothetical protein